MLIVTIEIVDASLPKGHPQRRRTLGQAEITNLGTQSDGTGNSELGDYAAVFNLKGESWGRSFVFNFARRKKHVWALLHAALKSRIDQDVPDGHDEERQRDVRHTGDR